MIGVCKLCLKEKTILKSHIIPRSCFKKIKRNKSQLAVIIGGRVEKSNCNPTEYLLCADCEHFLNINYERYGVSVLRDHKNIIKNKDHVIIKNFDYKKFYLYLISIFWRASISSEDYYASVSLSAELNELLRECIIRNEIKISRHSNLKIDVFFRVCVFRVVDPTKNLSDDYLKGMMTNFGFEKQNDGRILAYYIFIEGFAIYFCLSSLKDIHDARSLKLKSQLVSGSHQKIYKVDVSELPFLVNVLNDAIESSKINNISGD